LKYCLSKDVPRDFNYFVREIKVLPERKERTEKKDFLAFQD